MKLDDECIQQLVEAMKDGLSIDIACDYVGINRSTFFRWQKNAKQIYKELGEGTRKPSKLTPRQEKLVAFLKQMLQAVAAYELELLKRIKEQSPRWQASAWILERRFRERYARRVLVDDDAYAKDVERRYGPELAEMLLELLDTGEALLASTTTYDEAPLKGKELQAAALPPAKDDKN